MSDHTIVIIQVMKIFSVQFFCVFLPPFLISSDIKWLAISVADFIFWGPKITADDCSHEIKSCLLHGRKAMTNLDSVLKTKDITLPTKVHIVKAMVFQ